jgi:DedD protein
MQGGTRQRLVGALVLVCLSAIIWPILFSEDINPSIDRTSHIPPAPAFQKYSVAAPEKPSDMPAVKHYQAESFMVEPELQDDQASTIKPSVQPSLSKSKGTPKTADELNPKESTTALTITEKPSLNSDGLPVYWALQLASFRQKSKADNLQKSLLAKGYKVYTRTVQANGATMIRVYVGPKLDKSILLKVQKSIDEQFSVKSMLVRFSARK